MGFAYHGVFAPHSKMREWVVPPPELSRGLRRHRARRTPSDRILVGNVLQHSPRNVPVLVTVSRTRDELLFSVHNDEPTIPPDLLPHLFEPFRRGQGRPGNDARAGSLGLGLFIVREVAHAHRGAIEVTSTERDGTSLTVRLPVQPASPQVETSEPTVHRLQA